MRSYVLIKDGVQFKITPGGIRILAAFDYAAQRIAHDITITSGADGAHSGLDDPHHKGDAYDCRSHDLPDKNLALVYIKEFLGEQFYAFLEDAIEENEHIHVQVRKGTIYPPVPASNAGDVQEAVNDEN